MKTLLAKASRAFRPFKRKDLTRYPHYDEVVAAMEAAGFDFLGSGGARIVFALSSDLVLKVDMDSGGGANRGEADLWSTLPEYIRDHLAPVLWTSSDDRLLVMERATPVEYLSGWAQPIEDLQGLICDTLEAYGCYDADYEFNYGVLRGRLVLFDYNT